LLEFLELENTPGIPWYGLTKFFRGYYMQWFRSLSSIQKILIGFTLLFVSGFIYNWVSLLGFALLVAGGYSIYLGLGDFLKFRWMKVLAVFIVLVLPFGLGGATGEAIFNPSSSEVPQQAQEPNSNVEAEPEEGATASTVPSQEASSDNADGTTEPADAATGESSGSIDSSNQTEGDADPVSTNQTGLEELIRQLKVAAEVSTGYDRDLFKHWIDADGDGCDTRREVLIEESSTPVNVGSGCSISSGSWFSAYDSRNTTDASTFDIDHMVPLKEAWDSGAWAWDAKTRQAFANDLDFDLSLIAVSASSNRSKSDRDPTDWMPPNDDFWCEYITAWVQVKTRWSLSVDLAEKSKIERIAQDCSGQTLDFAPKAATATAAPSPTKTSTPSPSPEPSSTQKASGGCGPGQVDLNTASVDELKLIKYIDVVRAPLVIDLRPYRSVDQLINVKGIGPTYLQRIKDEGIACVD
jgi:DNA uptake protein ComE-like DNA-binding protein